jgi:hypothetical protein
VITEPKITRKTFFATTHFPWEVSRILIKAANWIRTEEVEVYAITVQAFPEQDQIEVMVFGREDRFGRVVKRRTFPDELGGGTA